MELGLEVYKEKAQCGTCHTMQAAGSEGNIGPNLDQLNAQMDQIIYVVTNGIGVMSILSISSVLTLLCWNAKN